MEDVLEFGPAGGVQVRADLLNPVAADLAGPLAAGFHATRGIEDLLGLRTASNAGARFPPIPLLAATAGQPLSIGTSLTPITAATTASPGSAPTINDLVSPAAEQLSSPTAHSISAQHLAADLPSPQSLVRPHLSALSSGTDGEIVYEVIQTIDYLAVRTPYPGPPSTVDQLIERSSEVARELIGADTTSWTGRLEIIVGKKGPCPDGIAGFDGVLRLSEEIMLPLRRLFEADPASLPAGKFASAAARYLNALTVVLHEMLHFLVGSGYHRASIDGPQFHGIGEKILEEGTAEAGSLDYAIDFVRQLGLADRVPGLTTAPQYRSYQAYTTATRVLAAELGNAVGKSELEIITELNAVGTRAKFDLLSDMVFRAGDLGALVRPALQPAARAMIGEQFRSGFAEVAEVTDSSLPEQVRQGIQIATGVFDSANRVMDAPEASVQEWMAARAAAGTSSPATAGQPRTGTLAAIHSRDAAPRPETTGPESGRTLTPVIPVHASPVRTPAPPANLEEFLDRGGDLAMRLSGAKLSIWDRALSREQSSLGASGFAHWNGTLELNPRLRYLLNRIWQDDPLGLPVGDGVPATMQYLRTLRAFLHEVSHQHRSPGYRITDDQTAYLRPEVWAIEEGVTEAWTMMHLDQWVTGLGLGARIPGLLDARITAAYPRLVTAVDALMAGVAELTGRNSANLLSKLNRRGPAQKWPTLARVMLEVDGLDQRIPPLSRPAAHAMVQQAVQAPFKRLRSPDGSAEEIGRLGLQNGMAVLRRLEQLHPHPLSPQFPSPAPGRTSGQLTVLETLDLRPHLDAPTGRIDFLEQLLLRIHSAVLARAGTTESRWNAIIQIIDDPIVNGEAYANGTISLHHLKVIAPLRRLVGLQPQLTGPGRATAEYLKALSIAVHEFTHQLSVQRPAELESIGRTTGQLKRSLDEGAVQAFTMTHIRTLVDDLGLLPRLPGIENQVFAGAYEGFVLATNSLLSRLADFSGDPTISLLQRLLYTRRPLQWSLLTNHLFHAANLQHTVPPSLHQLARSVLRSHLQSPFKDLAQLDLATQRVRAANYGVSAAEAAIRLVSALQRHPRTTIGLQLLRRSPGQLLPFLTSSRHDTSAADHPRSDSAGNESEQAARAALDWIEQATVRLGRQSIPHQLLAPGGSARTGSRSAPPDSAAPFALIDQGVQLLRPDPDGPIEHPTSFEELIAFAPEAVRRLISAERTAWDGQLFRSESGNVGGSSVDGTLELRLDLAQSLRDMFWQVPSGPALDRLRTGLATLLHESLHLARPIRSRPTSRRRALREPVRRCLDEGLIESLTVRLFPEFVHQLDLTRWAPNLLGTPVDESYAPLVAAVDRLTARVADQVRLPHLDVLKQLAQAGTEHHFRALATLVFNASDLTTVVSRPLRPAATGLLGLRVRTALLALANRPGMLPDEGAAIGQHAFDELTAAVEQLRHSSSPTWLAQTAQAWWRYRNQ
ncbi:hypothetical protein AB0P21_40725 [Kribbella sp. NPDC056861]|uniref:hypothetical protein n=1 Tax=Kribbella sp. NPDC056861 TaxID=3154857 RepID=UPI0034332DF4